MWEDLIHQKIVCKGSLLCSRATEALDCTAVFSQLVNGRVEYEINLQEQNSLKVDFWLRRCSYGDFTGSTEDSHPISVSNIRLGHRNYSSRSGTTLTGSIHYPNNVEYSCLSGDNVAHKLRIDATNLSLYRQHQIDIHTPHAQITLRNIADYNRISPFVRRFNSAGILSEIEVEFDKPIRIEETTHFISQLCSVLTLSQRSLVWPATTQWQGAENRTLRLRLEEPVFDLRRASKSLIPEESLPNFIPLALERLPNLYSQWRLGEAQDFYIQAMSLNSAWSQAVGFFTALETLKDAYTKHPEYEHFDRYVSRNQFSKKGIAEKVLAVLIDNFAEFQELLDGNKYAALTPSEQAKRQLEIQTLKSKVGELNRPAYKMVLLGMFDNLGVTVDNQELDQLVNLRNQIIHSGSPDLSKGPWNNLTQAHQWACRFAGLVERTILALCQYSGPALTYDKIVIPVTNN